MKTLSLIDGADEYIRLACQFRALAEGLTIELPSGLFIEIGDESVADYRHPRAIAPRGVKSVLYGVPNRRKAVAAN